MRNRWRCPFQRHKCPTITADEVARKQCVEQIGLTSTHSLLFWQGTWPAMISIMTSHGFSYLMNASRLRREGVHDSAG